MADADYVLTYQTSHHLDRLLETLPDDCVLYAMRGRVNGRSTVYICVSWALANDGNRSGMNWFELAQYGDAVVIGVDGDDNRQTALGFVRSPIQRPRFCFVRCAVRYTYTFISF